MEPTSPTVVSPTSMVSPTEQGWKILIKNADGTSNEVILEPKAPMHTISEVSSNDIGKVPDKKPTKMAPVSTKLRVYLVIQYILNGILAIVIIGIMALTLVKFNSSKNITGAWPKNPILSPTFLMLSVSVINLTVDAIYLLVQCCGARAIKTVSRIVIKVRNTTGIITAIAPAIAAGFSSFAESTSGGRDLWGWSCSPEADAMSTVNSSEMVCSTNTVAWWLQLLQILFQVLSLLIPLFAKWRPSGSAGGGKGAGDEKANASMGDEEAVKLIAESKAVFMTIEKPVAS